MPKIVYNACYGGFGLSDAAVTRYAEIKGLTLYPEKGPYGFTTYWLCPPEGRNEPLEGDAWHAASMEERQASNQSYSENVLTPRDIARADPVLSQVVEELGAAANDAHAKLAIAEIPTGTRYRIDEYDGFESVETIDSYDWKTA